MSFCVLVVPEDPTYNGYILKPLVSRMLQECGKQNARVTILTNPRAHGYQHAKRLIREQLIRRYRHQDLILFLPDADGEDKIPQLTALEQDADNEGVSLLCCAAEQEVEAWLLAGHTDKLADTWSLIRKDESLKERVFVPFLKEHGNLRRPGQGRDLLMIETLRNYKKLMKQCPELA